MTGHNQLIKLIIAYTLTGALVFTVIATCLSLVGLVKFTNHRQQNRLFTILIIQLVTISIGNFADFLKFNPQQVSETIVREDPTRIALATVSELSEELTRYNISGNIPYRKELVLVSLKELAKLDLGDLNAEVSQAVKLAESDDVESNRTLISDYVRYIRHRLELNVLGGMVKVSRIRYFIEKLPEIENVNVEILFNEAVNQWRVVAPIRVTRVVSRKDANVLVVTNAEAPNVIAFSNIGPPLDKISLRIVFSSEHDWTAKFFKAVATREFGHILGLVNTRTDGQLMSYRATPDTLPDKPQPEDIKRVRIFWNGI